MPPSAFVPLPRTISIALLQKRPVESPGRRDRRVDHELQPGRHRAPLRNRVAQRIQILCAHQRIRERLREHEPRLGPNRLDDRVVLAVVHNRDAAADPLGEPRQIRTRLVVDLTHQHGVAAGRHQDVEGQRRRLHAGITDQHGARLLEALQPVDQRCCGGGAVARVQMRQLRPAAITAEQKRRLALLPRDRARRAEEIELNGGFVGVQVGKTGAPRVPIESLRGAFGSARPSTPAVGVRRGSATDRATPRAPPTAGAPLTPALRGTGSLRPAPAVARRLRSPQSCLRRSSTP